MNKRMSFSDQHGMDLSTVHEVTDTHYKRTCLQRNAGLSARPRARRGAALARAPRGLGARVS